MTLPSRATLRVATCGVVALATMWACGQAQQRDSPAPASSDVLSRYSLDELQALLRNRTKKSVHGHEDSPTSQISTRAIIDTIRLRQKSIYGSDRRREYYAIQQPQMLAAAGSVAALVKPDHFTLSSNRLTLVAQTLGETENLCAGEAFAEQPSAAYCTAFVVGTDLIATAGHCIDDGFRSVRVVFGYRVENVNGARKTMTAFPSTEVYTPTELVSRKVEDDGEDYAVVRVDRPIANHVPLSLALQRSSGSHQDTAVYVLGYPSGLPLKLADGAVIRSETDHYFLANTDTFGGNSGSPVLDAVNHVVLGILDRGNVDYVTRDFCEVTFVCPTTGCQGEACTWLSVVAGLTGVAPAVAVETRMELRPIIKTFSSGLKLSGRAKSFSPEYEVRSEPAPAGYKIGSVAYALSGDRACGMWATCRASEEGGVAVFRFALQGHDEWPPPGQALSEGHLVVTYEPLRKR